MSFSIRLVAATPRFSQTQNTQLNRTPRFGDAEVATRQADLVQRDPVTKDTRHLRLSAFAKTAGSEAYEKLEEHCAALAAGLRPSIDNLMNTDLLRQLGIMDTEGNIPSFVIEAMELRAFPPNRWEDLQAHYRWAGG